MANIFDSLRILIENWLIKAGLTVPPTSGLLLVIVSVLISGFSGLVTRIFLDVDKMEREFEEMSAHQANKKKAMAEGDKRLWIKVKRNEERFMELQQKSMLTRMVPTIITWAPFIFIFETLRAAFQKAQNLALNGNAACTGGSCGGVLVLPFRADNLPIIGGWFSPFSLDSTLSIAGFGFCYVLGAVITSTILVRIFGVNLTGMKNNQTGMGF